MWVSGQIEHQVDEVECVQLAELLVLLVIVCKEANQVALVL